MIAKLAGAGIRVPNGFATTAAAFQEFLKHNQLTEESTPGWARSMWTPLRN